MATARFRFIGSDNRKNDFAGKCDMDTVGEKRQQISPRVLNLINSMAISVGSVFKIAIHELKSTMIGLLDLTASTVAAPD